MFRANMLGGQNPNFINSYFFNKTFIIEKLCFFDIHVKAISPMKNTNHVVLFRSSTSPPQLLSLYPTSL